MRENWPPDENSANASVIHRIQRNQNNSDCRITSQAVTEIERRHRDIISLECGVKELHEIFQDTALLLETQGELINNIEKNVTSAAEYVVDSKEETNKAVSFKKNRYKIASLPRFLKPFKKDNSI
uniref:Syntaxin 2a n=1 Tax=Nothobranchius furzeri TaxID=105023 RepID=A0A1A8AQJ9_NOTFU